MDESTTKNLFFKGGLALCEPAEDPGDFGEMVIVVFGYKESQINNSHRKLQPGMNGAAAHQWHIIFLQSEHENGSFLAELLE